MSRIMLSTINYSSKARGHFWLALLLAVIACVTIALVRFFPEKLGWNLASVGALALFSGARLRSWKWVLLPLALMLATDYWLSVARPGNPFLHHETPFVYGTYILLFALGHFFGQTENPVGLAGLSFGGSVVFFLVTNFGSWLNVAVLHTVDPWPGVNDYTADLPGLLLCYAKGLEFYRGTLAGDLVFSFGLFGAYALATRTLLRPAEQHEAVS
jgi:hypothetical protein